MDKDQAMDLAIYEAMCAALKGEPLSEFMESFPPVRSVMDLVAENKNMKGTICGERRFSEQLCNSLRAENAELKKALQQPNDIQSQKPGMTITLTVNDARPGNQPGVECKEFVSAEDLDIFQGGDIAACSILIGQLHRHMLQKLEGNTESLQDEIQFRGKTKTTMSCPQPSQGK